MDKSPISAFLKRKPLPQVTLIILTIYGVIVAVGKEILIPVGFARGSPQDISGIRIDKPSPNRVIVPATEVVESSFGVIDIPTIAQGIRSTEGGGHSAVGGHGRAPGVIGVGHHLGAAGVHKTSNVALGILQVEIPVAVVRHRRRASGVVGKVQLVAAPGHLRQLIAQVRVVVRCAVDCLGNALAVGIVAVGDAAAALAHGRQLASMLPGIRPRSVVQGIAYGIVGDGFPVIRRQQVRPVGVVVGVGGKNGIRILVIVIIRQPALGYVAAIVIGVRPDIATGIVLRTDQTIILLAGFLFLDKIIEMHQEVNP